ncbi:zinc finger protein 12-like isoform X2 [Sabethes cyaneus]|uniref:zinc finger protein 12-like isoform X2 n=1 Tax=Sabethes cyaneus TaxID=53552 RepID=UPI00237DD32A|nr:zinc finger protein 12-like isoform X2 [Sabethes cyaneus]
MEMDFNKICRLCCKQKDDMRFIREVNKISLENIFTEVLRLEIFDNDGLPPRICEFCISTLAEMNETIECYRNNDKKLRAQLKGFSEIYVKEELIDTDEEQQTSGQQLCEAIIEESTFTIKDEEQDNIADVGLTQSDNETIDEEWLSEYENQRNVTNEKSVSGNRHSDSKPKKRNKNKIRVKGRMGRPRTRFENPNRPRPNDFKCYICKSDSMGTPEALRAHLEVHLDQLPYTCAVCVAEKIVINSITTMNIHKRMHENPYKCPHCDRCYSNKRAVDGHIQTYHLGENAPSPSTCDKCGKVCRSLTSLKYHKRLHSSACACELCGKLFVDRHKLGRHIERKHDKLKKYECQICHKKLCSMDAIQAHFKTIHSTKEVNCEYCGKRYPSELSLRYHLKKHEQDPNSKFSSDWKNYYTEVITGDNPKPSKKCNLCGAVVKAISPHMRSVHFPKEYRCNLCEAVYKSKGTYDAHVMEHKFGKAYRCPICAKSLDWLDMKREAGINLSRRNPEEPKSAESDEDASIEQVPNQSLV